LPPTAVRRRSSSLRVLAPTSGSLLSSACADPRSVHRRAALLGSGYVGGPAGPYNYLNHPGTAYLGTNQPRIWDSYAATNTGNIDTTYGDGPDFARNDVFVFRPLRSTISPTLCSSVDQRLPPDQVGHRHGLGRYARDAAGSDRPTAQWQVSQEFQLLGKALDGRLNYVGGVYYLKEHGYVHDFVPFEALLFVDDLANDVTNEDYAAFFHGDFKLNDYLGFTAGRPLHRRKDQLPGRPGGPQQFPYFGPGPDNIFRYFPDVPDSQRGISSIPRWARSFTSTRHNELLELVQGFSKAAGPRPVGGHPESHGCAVQSRVLLDVRTRPQVRVFQHRLLVNAAVYYTDYKGIQLNIQQYLAGLHQRRQCEDQGSGARNGVPRRRRLDVALDRGLHRRVLHRGHPNANFPQYALPTARRLCPAGPPICGVKWVGCAALDAKLPKTPVEGDLRSQYTFRLPNSAQVRLIPAFTYTTECSTTR